MRKFFKRHSHFLHKLGLGLSFLCAIHCLMMPFFLIALPAIGGEFINHKAELILMSVSAIAGVIVLAKDYKVHESWIPLFLLLVASLSIILDLTDIVKTHSHLFTTLGSLLMASAYLINWRLHRKVCAH